MYCISYPGLDERDHGPDGYAGDGGGGEDAAGPLRGGRVGVHRAVILIHRELRHVRHLQDDDELGHGLVKVPFSVELQTIHRIFTITEKASTMASSWSPGVYSQ